MGVTVNLPVNGQANQVADVAGMVVALVIHAALYGPHAALILAALLWWVGSCCSTVSVEDDPDRGRRVTMRAAIL